MAKTLNPPKSRATLRLLARDAVDALLQAGFEIVNRPGIQPKSTAKKGATYIQRTFGLSAAFSNTGESITLSGTNLQTQAFCEVFIRVATRDGASAGRLRADEVTAIERATGYNFDSDL